MIKVPNLEAAVEEVLEMRRKMRLTLGVLFVNRNFIGQTNAQIKAAPNLEAVVEAVVFLEVEGALTNQLGLLVLKPLTSTLILSNKVGERKIVVPTNSSSRKIPKILIILILMTPIFI